MTDYAIQKRAPYSSRHMAVLNFLTTQPGLADQLRKRNDSPIGSPDFIQHQAVDVARARDGTEVKGGIAAPHLNQIGSEGHRAPGFSRRARDNRFLWDSVNEDEISPQTRPIAGICHYFVVFATIMLS